MIAQHAAHTLFQIKQEVSTVQKRSHMKLARALLDSSEGFAARRYEWAFLFGSIQPDCNPFSYLKGSLRGKTFGGHTYGNNRKFLEKRIHRLQKREHWHLWQYYTLGKLTHYVADAFTYPHNPHFPHRGWAHHVYEVELRNRMAEYLFTSTPQNREALDDLPQELWELHEQYLAEEDPGFDRDIQYILHASELLMACCRPAPRAETAPEAVQEEVVGEFA